jgi:hypothetical protein
LVEENEIPAAAQRGLLAIIRIRYHTQMSSNFVLMYIEDIVFVFPINAPQQIEKKIL